MIFAALSDPIRRRILEAIAPSPLAAGDIVEVIEREFGISQSAVSQHLRVLRDADLVQVERQGTRRVYSLAHTRLLGASMWLQSLCASWEQPLSALETEVARGKRQRRLSEAATEEQDSPSEEVETPRSRRAKRS